MGFFDRFNRANPPAAPQTPAEPAAAAPAEPARPATAGGVLPRLHEARTRLEARDLPAALAIYEELLANAGERADVLLTVSGDLGTHGHVREIVELIAPRYDAQRHGAGPGLNLLQAYLVLREAEPAQHVLDLLFDLRRPELEDRLIGFSSALAELSAAGSEGGATVGTAPAAPVKVSLVSISKPIWFYALETVAPHLLPTREGRLRRVAFAQLALPGEKEVATRAAEPEDELGRFTRGFPLWLHETFHAAAGYEPFAGIGVFAPDHYALFPGEWTSDNLRQLDESTTGGLDYIVTGALRQRHADYELTLRIWEVKKFRELKAFGARWTPATADAALGEIHAKLRAYMEWRPFPEGSSAGLAYAPPAAPLAHLHALGASLSQFLHGQQMLPAAHAPADTAMALAAAQANPADARAQLTLVTALLRRRAAGLAEAPAALHHAQAWLASEAAQAADAAALLLKLS